MAGLALAIIGRLLLMLANACSFGPGLSRSWKFFFDVPYSGTAFASVAIAALAAMTLNLVQFESWRRAYHWNKLTWLVRRRGVRFLRLWKAVTWRRAWRRLTIWRSASLSEFKERQQLKKRVALNWATRRQNNALLTLLSEAAQAESMVSVSLNSRKFYIGYVKSMPNLDPQEVYFRLYPVRSGYRSQDQLTFEMTTDYNPVQFSDQEDSGGPVYVILPMKDVQTINFFDPGQYEKHFAARKLPASTSSTTSWTGYVGGKL